MRKVMGPGSMSVWILKDGAEQKAESNHCVIKSTLMERDVHMEKWRINITNIYQLEGNSSQI